MAKTSQEVVRAALEHLTILGLSQPMPAKYLEKGKDRLTALFEMLQHDGPNGLDFSSFTVETIPEEVYIPFYQTLALLMGPMFGKPYPRQKVEEEINLLRRTLLPYADAAELTSEQKAENRSKYF